MEWFLKILNWLRLPKQFDYNHYPDQIETNMYENRPYIYCQTLDWDDKNEL